MASDDEEVHTHPSFGSVALNRVQTSGINLFGSATLHRGYVSLTIREAEAYVGKTTGEMRLFPTKGILEIAMTEAQFAELISKWNVGEGTACTITRRPDPAAKLISVEPPLRARVARETFESVIDESVSKVSEDIKGLADEIEALAAGRLPKKSEERLRVLLNVLRNNPSANLKFAQTMLHESMEKMMARAKLEMEAAGRSLLHRMGLDKMSDEVKKLLPSADFDENEE